MSDMRWTDRVYGADPGDADAAAADEADSGILFQGRDAVCAETD